MTSISAVFSLLMLCLNTLELQNLNFISDHLAEKVFWQDGYGQKVLSKKEALGKFSALSKNLDGHDIIKIHNAKWDADQSTYSVTHIANHIKAYRIFSLYQKEKGQFQIVKIRITEVSHVLSDLIRD